MSQNHFHFVPTYSHKLCLTHTHTKGRPRGFCVTSRRGSWTCDPSLGCEAPGVGVSQSWSTPACLVWLELCLPTHSHSWHVTHSTQCTARCLTAALHELTLWCSIKTPQSKSHWGFGIILETGNYMKGKKNLWGCKKSPQNMLISITDLK